MTCGEINLPSANCTTIITIITFKTIAGESINAIIKAGVIAMIDYYVRDDIYNHR